jgi:hypothetical protein
MSTGTRRSLLRADEGTSFVEAAVVLPILLVIVMGAFDFGRAFSTLSDAQRDLRTATRFLATLPASAVCGWGLVQARNLAVYGNTAGSRTQHLAGWETNDIILQSPTSCDGVTSLGVIRLNATVSYDAMIWKNVGLPGSINFNISHEERWQGE